ncbi:MAG: hypothetical protein Q7K03_01955 [Dehalococcoidia bacterium]|nr:hypothetical protein [Dehalococcoidia bacterium]
MLLTKSRISVAAIAIISLLLAFTLFRVAERASADNALGVIPGGFGDTTVGNVVDAWDWKASGANMFVYLRLDPATWAGKVFGMEVFVAPAVGAAPVQTQYLGSFGAFPTGQTICFAFTASKQPSNAPNNVGIHLIKNDQAKTSLLVSPGPLNTGLLNMNVTCAEAESAEPTPTPTKAGPAPTPTATVKPPVTGDFTPGSGMLMALLLAGFVLITTGGTYLLHTRPSRVRNS